MAWDRSRRSSRVVLKPDVFYPDGSWATNDVTSGCAGYCRQCFLTSTDLTANHRMLEPPFRPLERSTQPTSSSTWRGHHPVYHSCSPHAKQTVRSDKRLRTLTYSTMTSNCAIYADIAGQSGKATQSRQPRRILPAVPSDLEWHPHIVSTQNTIVDSCPKPIFVAAHHYESDGDSISV